MLRSGPVSIQASRSENESWATSEGRFEAAFLENSSLDELTFHGCLSHQRSILNAPGPGYHNLEHLRGILKDRFFDLSGSYAHLTWCTLLLLPAGRALLGSSKSNIGAALLQARLGTEPLRAA